MKKMVHVTMLAAFAAASLAAGAQTLYKLIDKDGKITYSNEKPKEYDGQVIPMTIDPNANTATLPKPAPGSLAPAGAAGADAARLEGAQERLARAKAALQDARDHPREGDINRVGNVNNSMTRAVPTEEYVARLNKLEDEVRQAEDAVAKLQKAPPR